MASAVLGGSPAIVTFPASQVGSIVIPAAGGGAAVAVTVPGLTASSLVLATPLMAVGETLVKLSVVPSANTITITPLNAAGAATAPANNLTVVWHVVKV